MRRIFAVPSKAHFCIRTRQAAIFSPQAAGSLAVLLGLETASPSGAGLRPVGAALAGS